MPGKRVDGRHFNMISVVVAPQKQTRFAVIVSKKVSKKAVVRNTIKRRTTEIIRTMLDKVKKGQEVVLLANKEASSAPSDELYKSILILFKKGGVLQER